MENPKCPYCGDTMELMESSTLPYTRYFYKCDNCGSTSPDLRMKTPEKAYAAAMKRDRAKGSMSLYIYKKLEEWLGAPCNLSFGDLCVSEFFTRYCGDFCDDCSEYENCWKKFFETLEETEANDER